MELTAKFTEKELTLLCEALNIASVHVQDDVKSEAFIRMLRVIEMLPKIENVDVFGS